MWRPAWLGTYLRGVAMGAADAVPGVSGGTIALLTGIYERLVAAITAVSPVLALQVLAAPLPGRRSEARRAFRRMDGTFLLVLGTGIVTAVVTVSRLLDHLLDAAPVPTFGLFFGLIGASAVLLGTDVSLDTPGRVAAAVAGFVAAYALSGPGAATLGSGPLATAAAGMVAVSAMILPGVSGSLLLLILGQYERMVETLRQFVDALVAAPGVGLAPAVEPGVTVATFVGGAVVGLLTVAHVVRRALVLRREATLAFLVSLVLGALRAPVVRVGEKTGGEWSPDAVAAFAAAAAVGAVLVVALERLT
jgi:putative membrane protein